MTVKEKMHSGKLYLPSDEEIVKEQTMCLEKLYDYNATRPLEQEKRAALLKEMPKSAKGAISSLRFMQISEDATFTSEKMYTPILI